MGAFDIIVIVVVSVAFVAVVGSVIYKKVKHKGDACGGMCSGCPYHSNCQSRAKVSREQYDKSQDKSQNPEK